MPLTRGFTGRGDRRGERADRLPPGQYDTGSSWPTLTAEVTPRLVAEKWTMSVDGLVSTPSTWTWAEMHALPASSYVGDIHCVTTWSKFDTTFAGVSVDILLEAAGPLPEAAYVMAHSTTGYTTNLPLADLTGGKAWVVWDFDGRPLTPEHGGPVRLLVPHLYFWKSAKWVTRLELMASDRPGFWEQNGYHDRGDPWLEQRYQGDPLIMAETPMIGAWTTGRVVEVDRDGELVRLRLDVADRIDHLPGQHCVLRLRAPDDYTAQRSYSIASDPADPLLEVMVERLPDGEVSGFLHDDAQVGDVLEVRTPIGGYFTWTGDVTAVCVAGGSGVVPIVSMLRYAARLGLADRLRVVAVGRTLAELPYADELVAGGAFVATTRENLGSRVAAPPYPEEVRDLAGDVDRAYVCGSVGFASYATRLLGEAGVRSDIIRVEQFGVTG